MMEKRREFGIWIKSIRNEKGLTLQQASAAIGYRSNGMLNTVEQGLSALPVEKLHPVARAYEIDVSVILDLIRECEPELYRKYTALQRDIIGYFTARVSAIGPVDSQGTPHEIRAHHAPFQLSGYFSPEGPTSDNVRNVNQILYIMSTWTSDTGTHREKPQKTTKTARLLQITPKTTNHPGHPRFAQGEPYHVEHRGNAGLLN